MIPSFGKTAALPLVVVTCVVGYATFRFFYHAADRTAIMRDIIANNEDLERQ